MMYAQKLINDGWVNTIEHNLDSEETCAKGMLFE